MISGIVHAHEAHVRLRIRGPDGQKQTINAIIDTGFTGYLTLPRALIISLGLAVQGSFRGALADGSERLFAVYEATIIWDRKPRRITIAEAEGDPLAGMSLLSGYELTIQVRPDGKVRIKRIP